MNIGIVGATGSVGEELTNVIEDNYLKINFKNIKFFASQKSAGKQVLLNNKKHTIEVIEENSFNNLDVIIFCASSSISKKYAPIAIQKGCKVIDNSSAFRMDKNIPLVIPEVNGDLVTSGTNLIANPNCCTALLCMVIAPLHKKYNINRLVISTYQSASGAGKEGLLELENQIKDYNEGKKLVTDVFGRQYLNNVFSHNSPINLENYYNEEELKMIEETNKILNSEIKISATCVRVPVFRAHCESVNIELNEKVNLLEVRDLLQNQCGVQVIDNHFYGKAPEPINSQNSYDVHVGRIRYDLGDKTNKTINIFLSGDQLLKGAALNAYQILGLIYNLT